MKRIYVISTNGEELTKVDTIEDCLDCIHTSLSEMMSDIEQKLIVTVEVRSGTEEEL